MNLNEAFASLGYRRGHGTMKRVDNIAPHGSARFEKDDVVISLSNGSLGVWKGRVNYYDSPNSLVLNAVVVHADNRGNGLGAFALRDLMEALRLCEFKGTLFCEATPIGGLKSPLSRAGLGAWYKRHGFVEDPDSNGRVYSLAVGDA